MITAFASPVLPWGFHVMSLILMFSLLYLILFLIHLKQHCLCVICIRFYEFIWDNPVQSCSIRLKYSDILYVFQGNEHLNCHHFGHRPYSQTEGREKSSAKTGGWKEREMRATDRKERSSSQWLELSGTSHAVTCKFTDLHVFKLALSKVSMGSMGDHMLSLIMYVTSSHLQTLTQTRVHIGRW